MSEEKEYKIKVGDKWFDLEVITHQTTALTKRLEKLEKTQITKVFYEQWVDKLTALNKEISEIKLNQTDGTPNKNFIAIRILKDGMNTIGIKIENRFNNIESVLREQFCETFLKIMCDDFEIKGDTERKGITEDVIKEIIDKLDGKKLGRLLDGKELYSAGLEVGMKLGKELSDEKPSIDPIVDGDAKWKAGYLEGLKYQERKDIAEFLKFIDFIIKSKKTFTIHPDIIKFAKEEYEKWQKRYNP